MSLLADAQIEVSTPTIVHPVLTDNQAVLIHQALLTYLNSPAGQIAESPEEEAQIKQQVSELVYFFNEVAYKPEQFPLRSVEDTKRISRAHRVAVKGPAQPKSLRNKRKARQVERMRTAKRARKNRRIHALVMNEKREKDEAAATAHAEAEARERQSRIDRFEAIARKEVMTNEDLQTVLSLFGSPEAAARAKELSAGEGFADRILGAASAEPESAAGRPNPAV